MGVGTQAAASLIMKTQSLLSLLLLCSTVAFAGCAAADPADEAGETEDAVSTVALGDVARVSVSDRTDSVMPETRTVGRAADVTKIVKAAGATGRLKVATAMPRCLPKYTISFRDALDKEVGTASFQCTGGADMKKVGGYLRDIKNNKIYSLTANLEQVNALLDASGHTLAESVGTADRAIVSRLGGSQVDISLAANDERAERFRGAVDLTQIPDDTAGQTRCAPTLSVVYYAGERSLGSVGVTCSGEPAGKLPGFFNASGSKGGAIVGYVPALFAPPG